MDEKILLGPMDMRSPYEVNDGELLTIPHRCNPLTYVGIMVLCYGVILKG